VTQKVIYTVTLTLTLGIVTVLKYFKKFFYVSLSRYATSLNITD